MYETERWTAKCERKKVIADFWLRCLLPWKCDKLPWK